MKNNITELVFILDRSGSMTGLESDTIGGFNSMIEKQKKQEGECYVSTVLFDDVSEVLHDRVKLINVPKMTDEDYTVRGCTALVDAIGDAIRHISNIHKYAREEDVPERTIFVITTDGLENASRRYTSEHIKKMIEYQKEKLESLIAEFRLQKVRKNLGDQLSGGERRRTEIARCLAIDPKFIMLDEPFAGVDPIAVEDIQHIVWKLKDKNIGILITDHNALETLRLTDRAYLLFEGKILFQGTPEELAENPVVREKYLGTNFVLRRKDFQLEEELRNKRAAQ